MKRFVTEAGRAVDSACAAVEGDAQIAAMKAASQMRLTPLTTDYVPNAIETVTGMRIASLKCKPLGATMDHERIGHPMLDGAALADVVSGRLVSGPRALGQAVVV
jgi:hypothetical protein